MSSVRPRLKPETPKTITGWETPTGRTVWLTQDGTWSHDSADLVVLTGAAAETALAEALTQEIIVTDPYFMEVSADGKIAGRETLRESIRASGPTVSYGGAD